MLLILQLITLTRVSLHYHKTFNIIIYPSNILVGYFRLSKYNELFEISLVGISISNVSNLYFFKSTFLPVLESTVSIKLNSGCSFIISVYFSLCLK